ncbi:hypothetical protein CFELI_14295 [Corynebacterium felinum]|uniref:Uncharacterized protein n=1 Tax=Corynebacterium felinum TaxID=131318 RepID=A0ABU2B6M0_9CORY|nr:hypothetical protein [Corynebacterium felinum]WJY96430.1 hypothetical protein CFELI_14295 [Corynebacterium felinum]
MNHSPPSLWHELGAFFNPHLAPILELEASHIEFGYARLRFLAWALVSMFHVKHRKTIAQKPHRLRNQEAPTACMKMTRRVEKNA